MKWTYSNNDGKHIINDERGILVAMVCDAETAESIVSAHELLSELGDLVERQGQEMKRLQGLANKHEFEARKLHIALEEVKAQLVWGDYETAIAKADEIVDKALGE